MITKELTDQLKMEVKILKAEQDKFLQTYKLLCIHNGGPEWKKGHIETVLHHVRKEVIPVMEQAGMEAKSVEALCSWAETLLMRP